MHGLDVEGPKFGWAVDGQGIHAGGYGLRLRAQDMAKIGLLFLQDGVRHGKQVVPAKWVRAATQKRVSTGDGNGYGYLWWVGILEGDRIYWASGMGKQCCQRLVVDISEVIEWGCGDNGPSGKDNLHVRHWFTFLDDAVVRAWWQPVGGAGPCRACRGVTSVPEEPRAPQERLRGVHAHGVGAVLRGAPAARVVPWRAAHWCGRVLRPSSDRLVTLVR